MIKALFFDIDGTLVSFKTHRIPQSTVDALQCAHDKGIKIYIATGRPIQIITNLVQIEKLIDGWITTNGAYCFIEEKVICCNPIAENDVEKIISASDRDNYSVIIVGEKHLAVHNYADIVDITFREGLGVDNIDYHRDIDSLKGQKILQLTPFCKEDQEAELMPTISNCTSGRWCSEFTDITAQNANKGKGIESIARHEGFTIEETMAFGDGGNDDKMLQTAGIGIAMGNANEKTKSIADYITTSVDEDGILNALSHFGII